MKMSAIVLAGLALSACGQAGSSTTAVLPEGTPTPKAVPSENASLPVVTPKRRRAMAATTRALAKVPERDRSEIVMLLACGQRKAGAVFPSEARETVIAQAAGVVARDAKAGSKCLATLPR